MDEMVMLVRQEQGHRGWGMETTVLMDIGGVRR